MTKFYIPFFILFLIAFFMCSCDRENQKPFSLKRINYEKLEAFDEKEHLQAIIEIPAGTNKKIEYNKEKKRFQIDQKEGKDRIINFLGYPGNYGFVPGTLSNKSNGGDGDPIDILVLSESVSTGTVLTVKPIATLLLLDENERDTKIIAVPLDSTKTTIQVSNFQDFMVNHDAAKRLIEDWFENYDGYGTNKFEGWQDADFALREVKNNLKFKSEQ